jgi:signal transduction histidine kinase
LTVEGRTRHELYLAVKEALHNVVAHARATEVEFQIQVTEQMLLISVRDNGTGFDSAKPGPGHGVRNYHARMVGLGGECQVVSRLDQGSLVTFKWPVTGWDSSKPFPRGD